MKKDFSDCANRYSVYWYRYNPKHEKGEDRLVTSEWERLTTREDFGITAPIDTEAMDAALAYIDKNKSNYINEEAYKKERARVEKSYKEVQNFGLPIYDEFIERDGKTYIIHEEDGTVGEREIDGQMYPDMVVTNVHSTSNEQYVVKANKFVINATCFIINAFCRIGCGIFFCRKCNCVSYIYRHLHM